MGSVRISGTAFRGVLVVLRRTEDAHATYSTGVRYGRVGVDATTFRGV